MPMSVHGNVPPSRTAIALPLILAGAAAVMAIYLASGHWGSSDSVPRPVTPRGSLTDAEKTTIEIYELNRSSVVHITSPEVLVRESFYGIARRPEGTGTGFIWDDKGYVVTNHHVIQDREGSNILVRLDSQKEYVARIVGYRRELDIAVLKILDPPQGLRPVLIGASENLKVGQHVLAIGNPFGLDHTLTTGVISALNRTIESIVRTPIRGVIQIDAAINPGNSGGPLLDSAGRLIGMNTAIYSPSGTSAGIGFAVPVDMINLIAPDLISGNSSIQTQTSRPIMGVVVQTFGFRGRPSGAEVVELKAGLGAAAAGLRGPQRSETTGQLSRGDVITAVDDQPVRQNEDLIAILEKRQAGGVVKVAYTRGIPYEHEERTAMVQLSKQR